MQSSWLTTAINLIAFPFQAGYNPCNYFVNKADCLGILLPILLLCEKNIHSYFSRIMHFLSKSSTCILFTLFVINDLWTEFCRLFACFLPSTYPSRTPFGIASLLLRRYGAKGEGRKCGQGSGGERGERKMKEKRAFISFFQNKCVCLWVKCKALPSVHCEMKL